MKAAAALLVLLLAAVPASAQRDHARVAVPYYRPAQVIAGMHAQWSVPRALAFQQQALALHAALRGWCAGPAAGIEPLRERWRGALTAWETLATPALGPVLERRSPRQIDFAPARAELIRRAVAQAPADAAAMERIGTPAKGFPALEWLLWTQPLRPATPECSYAVQVAADIEREASALADAFHVLAARDWEEEAGDAAFAELLNQWIGGVERLRWQQIDKPLREAATAGRADRLPRAASSETAASWARQWQALRGLAVFGGEPHAPVPGRAMVPLETYLRGRGLNALADRLTEQVERCSRELAGLEPGQRARAARAVRELARLKKLAEDELAPALRVTIGFSDADGD